jgi:hypothetical protein
MIDCGSSKETQEIENGDDRVSEVIVLVGSFLCHVPQGDAKPNASPQGQEHGQKKAQLISESGREIVGPGYSRHPSKEELTQKDSQTYMNVEGGTRIARGQGTTWRWYNSGLEMRKWWWLMA